MIVLRFARVPAPRSTYHRLAVSPMQSVSPVLLTGFCYSFIPPYGSEHLISTMIRATHLDRPSFGINLIGSPSTTLYFGGTAA